MLSKISVQYTQNSKIIIEEVSFPYQPNWKELAGWITENRQGFLNSFQLVPTIKGQ